MVFGFISKAINKVNTAISNVGNTQFASNVRELVGEKASAVISNVANKALTVLTNPIQSISNFKKAEEATLTKAPLKLVAEGAQTALIAVTPFTATGKTLVAKATTAAFGSIPKAIASTTILGAVVASPTIRETVANVVDPVENIERGFKVGEFIETLDDKTKDATSKITTGVALGLGGLAVAGVGALLIPPAIEKVKDIFNKDEGILGTDDTIPAEVKQQTLATNTATPTLPEVVSLKAGTPKKRKKKRSVKRRLEGVRVSQRVNVLVNNNNRKVYKGVHIC